MAKQVAGIRDAAAESGRDPQDLTVFVQLAPVVAETSARAYEKFESYRAASSREGALALFSGWTGLDLADLPPGRPLRYADTDAGRTALASFTTDDPDRGWTVADIADHVAVGGRGPVAVGSPTEVADEMEQWIDETGADGFNLAYATTPGTFVDVAELVVPDLRHRGRMPATPTAVNQGGTLRQTLGGAGPRVAVGHPAAAFRRST